MTKTAKSELLVLVVLLLGGLLPTALLMGGGFYTGRWYERTHPHQSNQMVCEECRAGGVKEGLGTCSDVLKQEDENGNY